MGAKVSLTAVSVYPLLLADDADRVKKRETLEGGHTNFTCSLKDIAFDHYRTSQPQNRQERLQRKKELSDWNCCLNKAKPSIESHLEQRVSLAFLQAVMCYKTDYRFREGHTIHQGNNAQALGPHKFNAAHPATLPCLYASSPNDQQEFVYSYRSGYYDQSNSTNDLPLKINDADRAIDEKYTESVLRTQLVNLLNRAASGKLTPEQVIRKFIDKLATQIEISSQRESDPHVRDVLQLYRARTTELQVYVTDPKNLDSWLDLRMDDPLLGSARQVVQQLKQNELLDRASVLSLIKKKVAEIPAIIMQERHQRDNEGRAPNHFYDLFHRSVLRLFRGNHRLLVEEALEIQYQLLRNRVKHFQKIGATKALIRSNKAKIKTLFKEIIPITSSLLGQQADLARLNGLSEEKPTSLRPGIYQLRYSMIRADQDTQSKIKSKVESVFHAITPRAAHQETFFYYHLFNKVQNLHIRTMLYKLFNISGTQLEQKVREIRLNQKDHAKLENHATQISQLSGWVSRLSKDPSPKNKALLKDQIKATLAQIRSSGTSPTLPKQFCKRLYEQAHTPAEKQMLEGIFTVSEQDVTNQINALISKKRVSAAEQRVINQSALMQNMVNDIFAQINALHAETRAFRRKLMVELRLLHGMSQKHFKAIYRERFPRFPMSDGTMSNLENGAKLITADIIGQVSQIFGVDSSLFYPSHFAEV